MAAEGQEFKGEKRLTLEKAREAVARQLDNLTKPRLRDLLTDEEYVKHREELERERGRVAGNLGALDHSGAWFEPARLLISFSNGATFRFREGDLQTKRLILDTVGSNPVLKDEKLNIDAKKPFRKWSGTASVSCLRAFVEDVRTLMKNRDHTFIQTTAGVRRIAYLSHSE